MSADAQFYWLMFSIVGVINYIICTICIYYESKKSGFKWRALAYYFVATIYAFFWTVAIAGMLIVCVLCLGHWIYDKKHSHEKIVVSEKQVVVAESKQEQKVVPKLVEEQSEYAFIDLD